jgi:hypothetical protein
VQHTITCLLKNLFIYRFFAKIFYQHKREMSTEKAKNLALKWAWRIKYLPRARMPRQKAVFARAAGRTFLSV